MDLLEIQAIIHEGDRPKLDDLAAWCAEQELAERKRLLAPDSLQKAARWYASHGVAVFPLRPGAKQPMTKNGLYDATTDLDQVKAWWEREPLANIGLPTGHLFDVIDIDRDLDNPAKPNGWLSLDRIKAAGKVPPTVGRVLTPSHGGHYYIKPLGVGNATNLGPGVDYRGKGGYGVGPPSRSAKHRRLWSWAQPPDLTALREEQK